MTIDDELERMRCYGYDDVRRLEDDTLIGIGRLLYTTAVYIDLNDIGWGQRFCFEDRALARSEFERLKNGDEEPVGWIARRPER